MLSLGKLSQLAQLHENDADVDEDVLDCQSLPFEKEQYMDADEIFI